MISQGAFADLIVCLTEFSKNHKFQKKSLQAIETLKSSVPKMLRTPECPLSERTRSAKESSQAAGLAKQLGRQTQEEQYWFPVLFAFHDVLMTGEDLEVRSRYDYVLTLNVARTVAERISGPLNIYLTLSLIMVAIFPRISGIPCGASFSIPSSWSSSQNRRCPRSSIMKNYRFGFQRP